MLMHVCAPAELTSPTAYLSATIAADAEALAQTRRAVRGWLAASGLDEAADSAVLLMNELATNVQQHAPGPARLRLFLRPGMLRCEVLDTHRTLPVLVNAGADAERGRGLHLVDTLALCWGSVPAGRGKAVWFELPLPRAARETAAQ
ncbi:ATP-binding protein [Streptomyces violens]|uniref:ATP-binding protein n=1 Tax=Streptomyces violens TaxID=66377 RepID=UPI000A69EA4E|nr:ATP-binding protein [Streptomyces violens]